MGHLNFLIEIQKKQTVDLGLPWGHHPLFVNLTKTISEIMC